MIQDNGRWEVTKDTLNVWRKEFKMSKQKEIIETEMITTVIIGSLCIIYMDWNVTLHLQNKYNYMSVKQSYKVIVSQEVWTSSVWLLRVTRSEHEFVDMHHRFMLVLTRGLSTYTDCRGLKGKGSDIGDFENLFFSHTILPNHSFPFLHTT